MMGWGVQFSLKKRYVTLELPLTEVMFRCRVKLYYLYRNYVHLLGEFINQFRSAASACDHVFVFRDFFFNFQYVYSMQLSGKEDKRI